MCQTFDQWQYIVCLYQNEIEVAGESCLSFYGVLNEICLTRVQKHTIGMPNVCLKNLLAEWIWHTHSGNMNCVTCFNVSNTKLRNKKRGRTQT